MCVCDGVSMCMRDGVSMCTGKYVHTHFVSAEQHINNEVKIVTVYKINTK